MSSETTTRVDAWYMDPKYKFMNKLNDKMKEGKADITTRSYLARLVNLNDKQPLSNFTFLKDTDKIQEAIKSKAPSTQLSYYTAINAALSTAPSYKKLLNKYIDIAKPMWDALNLSRQSHEKSEKQKESIVSNKSIVDVRNELAEEIAKLDKLKVINEGQYDKYLMYLLVSLYTYIPPRRNMDYGHMYVVKKEGDDRIKNYLVLKDKQFVFNKYKTSGVYGKQVVDIPDDLMDVIQKFIKRHPGMKKIGTKSNPEAKLLMRFDNTPLNETNGITRMLNKAFGKKIAASALRHIYLSDKYGETTKEKEKDAKAMAHSLSEQNEYIKY